jgi:hypothetical protein
MAVPTVVAAAPTVVPAAAAMRGAPAAAAVVAAASCTTHQNHEWCHGKYNAYRDNSDTRCRVGNRVTILAIVYKDFERKPDWPNVLELDGLSWVDIIGEMECTNVFEGHVEFGSCVVRNADAGHY